MPETKLEHAAGVVSSSVSLRVMAGILIFACVYYASALLITLVVSVLIAFMLDPVVDLMERVRVPRWAGALAMVLIVLVLLWFLAYLLYGRAEAFVQNLPAVSAKVTQFVDHFENVVSNLRQSTSSFSPSSNQNGLLTVQVQQQQAQWTRFLLRGVGSIYSFTVTVMFIPFLVFFMLTSKHHLKDATIDLFSMERHQQIEDILESVTQMVRQYIFGSFLVALISMALITPVFLLIHLRYAIVLGGVSAFLDLVPYIGIALAILPPLVVALMQFNTAAPIIIIGVVISAVHLLSVNLFTPKLVGGRVRLSALSVTISMMLWGWLWGAMGLVLAVPITAAFKTVCDNVPTLKPFGYWLGDGG